MKFEGALFAVRDMAVSRSFYENVLGRTVAMDLGTNLVFDGGPTLQQGFGELVGFPPENTVYRAYNSELYFETTGLDEDVERIKAAGAEVLHEIKEYPWGQRAFRFFDPDGHIIELGEAMDHVVGRFLSQGMSQEDVSKRTMYPLEVVKAIASGMGL